MPRVLRAIIFEIPLLIVVAVAALCSGWFGVSHVRGGIEPGGRNLFQYLAPSVVQGAGLGIGRVSCSEEEFPALGSFLRGEIDVITRDQYPERCEQPFVSNYYYLGHIYLFAYLGLLFRIFGISVWAFQLAGILMHLAAALLLYALFRQVMGRLLSLAGSLLVAAAPAYLIMLTTPRDFGKAPFVLAVLLLIGMVIKKPRTRFGLLAICLLLGLTLGIGYGFRLDLLVFMPCSLIIVIAAGGAWDRKSVAFRFFCAALLLLVFAGVAAPAIRGNRSVGHTFTAHTLHQGVMKSVEKSIGINSPSYDFGYMIYDPVIIATINNHARLSGVEHSVLNLTEEYGEMGLSLFREIFRTFPADFITRTLAASLQLNYVLADATLYHLLYSDMFEVAEIPSLVLFLDAYKKWMICLAIAGIVSFWICLAVVAAKNYVTALSLLFLYLFLGAYPALLFEFRHYFHLAFIPVFFTGFALSYIGAAIVRLARARDTGSSHKVWIIAAARGSAFVVISAFLLLGSMQLARYIQTPKVMSIHDAYKEAVLTPLPTVQERRSDTVLLRPAQSIVEMRGAAPLEEYDLVSASLAIGFSGAHHTVEFTIHNANATFRRPCRLSLSGDDLYFFPVFEFGWDCPAVFEGIEFAQHDIPYVTEMYIVETPPSLLFWPYMHIPAHPQYFQAFKTSPLDTFLRACVLEVQAFFGFSPAEASLRYARSLRHEPDSAFIASRALAYSRRAGSIEVEREVWKNIGAYFPAMRHQASCWFSEQAKAAVERGDYAMAIRLCESAGEAVPYESAQLEYMGDILADTNELEQALAAYRQALSRSPEAKSIADKLTALFSHMDVEQESVAFWKELCNMHPESVIPHVYLAMGLERAGNMEDAVLTYSHALTLDAENAEIQFRLGVAQVVAGAAEAGIMTMRAAAWRAPELAGQIGQQCAELATRAVDKGDLHLAIGLYEAAAEIAPQDIWHRVHLAALYEETGAYEKAIELHRHVLETIPESPVTAAKLDVLFQQMSMDEEALLFWRELCGTHPETFIPCLYMGITRERMGDTAGSLRIYQELAQREPENAQALFHLGALLVVTGATEAGMATMRDAARHDPEWASRVGKKCVEIAETAAAKGALDLAIALCETAIEVAPQEPWYHLQLGALYETLGDLTKALKQYGELLQHQPDNAEALLRLGALQIVMGETKAGMAAIRKSVQYAPELNSSAGKKCAELAADAVRRNAHEQAVALYRAAIEIVPQDLWHRVHLGELLETLGRDPEALALYQGVLRTAPESPYTADKVDAWYMRHEQHKERIRFWCDIAAAHPEPELPRHRLQMAIEQKTAP